MEIISLFTWLISTNINLLKICYMLNILLQKSVCQKICLQSTWDLLDGILGHKNRRQGQTSEVQVSMNFSK